MCCHYLSAFRFVSQLSISAFLCVSSRAGKDTFSVGQQPSLILTEEMGKYNISRLMLYRLEGTGAYTSRLGHEPGHIQDSPN